MYRPTHLLLAAASCMLLAACNNPKNNEAAGSADTLANLTQYVDPYIGSGFHGHVFVGANVPFGAVQLGPTQITDGWDWCSGYHYSDSVICGFSQTHLSGTGIGDLGDIAFMPITGKVNLKKGSIKNLEASYSSLFSHNDEQVKPGFYSVKLKKYNVQVELTATTRVGIQRYTFPEAAEAHILVDLQPGIGWDLATETHLEQLNDSTLAGYRYSTGWAKDQRIFFAAVFSKPINHFAVYDSIQQLTGTAGTGKRIKGVISFATQANEQVIVKTGISPVSIENAVANIRAELPGRNFDQTAQQADAAWNQALNKVQVQASGKATLRTFYTALYHTMIAPSIFNDHNGDYRGSDTKVYHDTSFVNYTTFSLWDTYRAAHSLYTIVEPARVKDMVSTMLKIHEQQGKLPVWHLMGNETNTMPGNSAFPVLADAYLKGLHPDGDAILNAMKASALLDERGLKFLKTQGFIPADAEVESVSRGLEYSIDDWSAAQVANKLGRQDDYAFFEKRGKNYQYYFDPKTRFVRGRISETKWRTPFSPFVMRHMKDDFAEGNAWQYTWLVPHDVEGLVQLLGGEQPFIQKLDSLFIITGDMGEEASNDITGLIGLYAHGNEPSHHITYLYGYIGQPWKTAEKVRYIMDHLYSDRPDGLSGNEDVGQMSAWYVFSALGFYPANPANGAYVFGSPAIDEATLRLENGKTFKVKVENNSAKNIYIQSIKLNGQAYTKAYFLYRNIMQGGEMIIMMGDKPSETWGVKPEDRAKSVVE
jgi:predicted alpha-1,2-mannosidase